MSTISWSSVDWRLRSGFAFIAASTAACGFFFASSHDFDRRAHEAPHEVGFFRIVSPEVMIVMPTMLAPKSA
jgi:hypothetical protein